jgi:hypothetical protein
MEHILLDRNQRSLGSLDQMISRKGHSPMFIGAVYSEIKSLISMKKEGMCMH